jgi:hypothetical protein
MHQRTLLQIAYYQEDFHHSRYSHQSLRYYFHFPAFPAYSGIYTAQLPQLGKSYACAGRDLLIYVEGYQSPKLLLEHPHLLPSIRAPYNHILLIHIPVRHQRAEMVR